MAEFVISSGIELLEVLLQRIESVWAKVKFLDEKPAILKESEEHLQWLKTDLKRESSGSRNLHHLISQVREMAHDAGVNVDTFIFIKSEELEAIRLNNFLKEIKSNRIRFLEVNRQSPVEEEEDDGGRHRRPCWEGEDEDAVGLDGIVKTLIHSFVLSWQRWRFSMMIIGVGGIGKTTLARTLYNHVVVAKRFECRGWACVSIEFRPEEVLRVLIRQMVNLKKEEAEEVMEKMSLRRLKDMLRQHLYGKRYFIVLDGVWDDTSFKHVLFALPREENSSRVLLTCRRKNKVEVVDCTFSLGPLSSDASWHLFLKMVFTNDHKCPRHLEKTGRKIVKICSGLPFAIKEVGRKLAMKSQTVSSWEEFLKSIDFSKTIAVLELSYPKLSQELKSCFVHASFFKKEFVISPAIDLLEFLLQKKVPPYYWVKDPKFLVDVAAAILKGSEEHLQGLKTDLRIMLGFLIKSSGSRNLNHLISQVREMAHDAGVFLETFIFIKSEELEAVRLNNFLTEIKSIRIRFREVNLQSPVEEEEDGGGRHRRPSWEGEDEDAVGLDGIVKALIQSFVLSCQRWRFSVMIIGMGGIGKTTLARKLYNHVVVAKRFECRGWACVSSEFRPEEVLRVLILQMVKLKKEEEEVIEKMSLSRLKDMLHQHLYGKRYFIVLDGVWDDTSFKHVLSALPREENSSRVLLTCRCKNKVEVVDCTFSLGPLSSDASWQLFLKMVFTNDHKCPRHLEKTGRKIVKMCNGLPLAIKEVGRKLAMKSQTVSSWEDFLESIDFSETIAVLELSYHKLSQELKSCFVHASFFKKGTTISIEKFIHIWIAAGMAMRGKVEDYAKMEENAREYLDKLSDEYMVILVYSPLKKELRSLYLDSFHHKISITKAEEEIFLQILGNEEHGRQPCKPRHLVICCSREKFDYSTKQEKHLISLFFHGGGIFDATPSYWESFEQLRILDFEGFGLTILSERVCALGTLRYLGLRDNYIQELPHTLGCLKNLEVLDIALNFMLEVPDIIWEMDNLRHLYLSDIICRTPLKIDSLKYLQTLTYISADNWTYEVSNLEDMTSLRKLGIDELDESSNVSKLFASLAKLKNLECLILRGFRFRSMPPLDDLSVLKEVYQIKLDGRLTKLPKFPKGIRRLTLVNSCLDVDPMPELEKIFFLSYLKLRNAYTGREMVFSRRGSRIHTLRIIELWHLRNLRVEKSFSNYLLGKIEICNCPFLNNIPKEIIAFASDKWHWEGLKIMTTKKIEKAIRQSEVTYKTHVDFQP